MGNGVAGVGQRLRSPLHLHKLIVRLCLDVENSSSVPKLQYRSKAALFRGVNTQLRLFLSGYILLQ